MSNADFRVTHHGSISLIEPLTSDAVAWFADNVPDDAQYLGNKLSVEPRYLDDIVAGMEADGLLQWTAEVERREITYTDAPVEYDYTGFGTRDEGVIGKTPRGRDLRKVSTKAGFYTENQRMRYGSGLHYALTQERFDEMKDLVLAVAK